MYRAAPRSKALTVALVTPNKPNSRCAFAAVTYIHHVHGELAPPTRSESFGVDSSCAMVVFPITMPYSHVIVRSEICSDVCGTAGSCSKHNFLLVLWYVTH